jgi:hypothetical protein
MQVCKTAMTFKVKTQMKDRSSILHTPPCNSATGVKILLWSKIAYKRNSVYRVRVKRGLPVFGRNPVRIKTEVPSYRLSWLRVSWLFSVSPTKCYERTLKRPTAASFQILTYHSRRYITYLYETFLKYWLKQSLQILQQLGLRSKWNSLYKHRPILTNKIHNNLTCGNLTIL